MPWQDRVSVAAYTPPSGISGRIEFEFENVARNTQKRTAAFSFPGVDGNYIQDNGFGARAYPLRCFFSGTDHDIAATQFELALLEQGPGKLEHPFYGTFTVVPFGQIARRDDLKTAANQTIIEVAFWTTTTIVYPSPQLDSRNELQTQVDTFISDTAGAQFAANIDVSTVIAQANLAARVRDTLTVVEGTLGALAKTTQAVNEAFQDAIDAINFSIDVLVGQPLLLAQQVANLITLPARSAAGITDRLVGYANFSTTTINGASANPADAVGAELPRRAVDISNAFHNADLAVASSINGVLQAVLSTQFETRPDAVAAAESVCALFDQWVAWRDPQFEALGEIDGGTTYQQLQESVALTAGFLVEISFQTVPEFSITLDRRRTIVDVSGEIYGTISNDRLNDIIDNNDLTGSQILELQRGDTIVYYP